MLISALVAYKVDLLDFEELRQRSGREDRTHIGNHISDNALQQLHVTDLVFYNILQKNMQPVYDSARRKGYEIWNFYRFLASFIEKI